MVLIKISPYYHYLESDYLNSLILMEEFMTMQMVKKRCVDLKTEFEAEKNKLDVLTQLKVSRLFYNLDTCFKEFDDNQKAAEDKIKMITTMIVGLEKSSKDQAEENLVSIRKHLADIELQTSAKANMLLDKVQSLIKNITSTVDSEKQANLVVKKLDLDALQTLLGNLQTKTVQFETEIQSADPKQKVELIEKRNTFITEMLRELREQSSLLEQFQPKNLMQEMLKPILEMGIEAAILALQAYQKKPIGNETAAFTPAANAAANPANSAAGAPTTDAPPVVCAIM